VADTLVTASGDADDDLDFRLGLWGPYWINTTTAVIIGIDRPDKDISFWRTTDGGVNWSKTVIENSTCEHVAAWFDQETPGDSGTLIHVAFLDSAGDDAHYVAVDVSAGTAGTIRLVDDGVTVSTTPNLNRLAITKTKNGNLLYAFSTQTEIECYRSTDAGENWTDRPNVFEVATAEDWVLLYSANTADDADAAALFWDRSSNVLSVKMFDDSASSGTGTWTETTILTDMIDDDLHRNMDGVVRHSDGLIVGAAHSNDDNSADDIVTFTVNPNSIASPTIDTTTANVFTNEAESAQIGLLINQQNDDVYVAWFSGGTWLQTVDCVYKKSDDDMASWGTEQAYSEQTADDFRILASGRTVGNNGGFFQPTFFNDDTATVYVNLVNDVAIAAAVAATGHGHLLSDRRNHLVYA